MANRLPGRTCHRILAQLDLDDAAFAELFMAVGAGTLSKDGDRKKQWGRIGAMETERLIYRDGPLFVLSPAGKRELARLDAHAALAQEPAE